MTGDATLKTREAGGKTIIDVDTQNIDFRNCESMKATIGNIVSEAHKDIVLNLENVNFIDSSGLSVLLFGKRSCDQAGGVFAICGLQPYVENLIKLTNLDKTLPVYENAEKATAGQA